MPDALPHALHLRVPTDLMYVRPVRKMLEGLLYGQGWEEDDVDDASLIITEIVQNSIEHGSKGDGSELVDVTILVGAESLDFEVVDPGSGRDPQIAVERDVEAPVPLDQPRGRGLILIHRLTGAFERTVSTGGGLCIRARKEVGS